MKDAWPALPAARISVVVCNYNYADYIVSAVQSVIAQTYAAHQIIVVDDGSTDDSVARIRQYFPQVTLLTQANAGQRAAYNTGLTAVTGEVVLFLDSDDELLPHALHVLSTAFSQDVVKVHGKMHVIDNAGVSYDTVLPSHLDAGDCGKALIAQGVLYKSPPATGNAYRVDALKRLFPLPQSLHEKHGADYFCIYGICVLGLIGRIEQPIIRYRLHQSSQHRVDTLGFGNALKKQDRARIMQQRWEQLTAWIEQRLHRDYVFCPHYLDFTQQKLYYASDLLHAIGLWQRLHVLKIHRSTLFKSIEVRHDLSTLKRLALTLWVVALPILPSRLLRPVAMLVCNPVR